MKSNVGLKFLFIFLLLCVFYVEKVGAIIVTEPDFGTLSSFPSSFTVNSEGSSLTLDNNLNVSTSYSASDNLNYPYFHIKNSSAGKVICVSGNDVTEPSYGTRYSTESWTNDNHSKGVAYIINKISGNGGDGYLSGEKYYWTQILINAYLGTYSPSSGQYMYDNVINTSKTIAGTGLTYNQILKNARDYAATDYTVSLSANKYSLTFTKNSDGYWYSEPITITSNTDYNIDTNNNKLTYTRSGNNYTFKIKDSEIALGSSESFSVNVSNSNITNTYYTAQRYGTSSSYQDLTLSRTLKHTNKGKTITLNGSVTRSTESFEVVKVNSKGEKIAGAKIAYQTEADKKAGRDTIVYTTSATSSTKITGLVAGKYYIYEKEAPKGYNKSDKVIEIVVSNDGTIKIDGKTSTDGVVKLVNELTETKVSKVDATTGKELPGATLQILDSNKKNISCTVLQNGLEKDLSNCTWTSGESSVDVIGLAQGKYYLKETIAPEGYVLSTEMVGFTVKADGTINEVVMNNKLNNVRISKVNSIDKNYLKGASLEIQDEKGNIIKHCTDEKGNKNVECKWVSLDEAFIIEGLPNGKYYLVETAAPEGYVLNKEKIEFIVDGTKDVIDVEMVNQLEVKVPNTLSSRSALLLAIAMFDVALGIGVLTYVKKNKA